MDNLALCEANNFPLTPITFLKRASECYPNRTSIIYGETRFTWPQTYARCCRLAASLLLLNITRNDVVSVLAQNIPAMYEMHFAVPMAGAVLNTINTRLNAKSIAGILRHAQPKILFVDCNLEPLARETLHLLPNEEQLNLLVIFIDETEFPKAVSSKELDYEGLIRKGEVTSSLVARMFRIQNEHDPISLNYTSGTTADPKGVVVSHRGAYLTSLGAIMGWEMGTGPVYLWTLPMFHCNGWTLTWSVAARGGTNVCIRQVNAQEIFKAIELHSVTHMCCVPTVFNILLQGKPLDLSNRSAGPVQVLTGGSSPPASLVKKVQQLGFQVTHVYGLTESTGPAVFCEWHEDWNRLPENKQMELKARQGVGMITLAELDVKNTQTQESVPRDGKTMGEIVIKGSSIMKWYLKNPKASYEAFKQGWLNTGDIGVIHPDGHIEIKDRSKDIIISGGENISSLEVENALNKHHRVLETAVVAMPHPVWGETPCAFVVLEEGVTNQGDREDKSVDREGDLIEFCRENLPHFMCPRKVIFLEELPKNSNGKILKYELRHIAKALVVDGDDVGSTKVQGRTNHISSRL